MVLVSKVFLARVKRVPLRIMVVQRRSTRGWECFHWRGSVPMWLKGLTLEGLPLEGECTNVVEGTHP